MHPSVVPLPAQGDVFVCVGTLQLPRAEVPRLIVALAGGLAEESTAEATSRRAG